MPGVTYIEFDGAEHTVEVAIGTTLMRGAVENDVPGINADCGGQCACATCHIYVDAAWLDKPGLPEPAARKPPCSASRRSPSRTRASPAR
jgi:2Fe-2S ferredoxin